MSERSLKAVGWTAALLFAALPALCVGPGSGAMGMGLPHGGQVPDLSCFDALVAIGQGNLAGVFSFIQEKDEPAAFADLIVHDPAALKKFLRKVEGDFKAAQGITAWDKEVLLTALNIYASPLADSLDKPNRGTMDRMARLSAAKPLTLEEVNLKRGSKKQ